ncbi:JmjC domain-containing protein [Xylophilus sp.]|uniref:JmjC domain-containing protein n=1 Tax=Xylophilus sp. TaxID=2653893 RepID=UPI0013BBA56F|nr:cupin domain-containing protein [Xylophilus sp.]KAF1045900.1 MAG: putative protein YxbC [Xylophilus sp.]
MTASLLNALFAGRPFAGGDREGWFAVHGGAARLPAVLRQPVLASFDALAQRYRGPLSFGRGLRDPQTFDSHASPARLARLGLTVYLRDIAPAVPGAHAFLQALEAELGIGEGTARLTAFASPGDEGVSLHYDAEEVISVQLAGRKTFHVAPMEEIAAPYGAQFGPGMAAVEDLYEQLGDRLPDPARARFETVEMAPGSVLWLPRGTWHRTEARGTDSFSLTIALRPQTALDALLAQLEPLLRAEVRWRRPLYGLRPASPGRADALAPLHGLLSTLPATLARLPADALAPRTEPERIAAIGPASRFARVPTSRLEVGPAAPGRALLVLHAWDRDWVERETLRTEIPAAVAPLARHLAAREGAFAARALHAEFAALPAAHVRQLLQLLVRSHFLRLLALPDSSAPT